MVKLTQSGFVIEVKTDSPETDYAETLNDVINLLQSQDTDMSDAAGRFYLFELLKEMMPTATQASAMFELVDENADQG